MLVSMQECPHSMLVLLLKINMLYHHDTVLLVYTLLLSGEKIPVFLL